MFRSFFLSRRWALWAWGGLLVLVALVFITVQQTVKLNTWYGEFYDLLQKPEQAGGLVHGIAPAVDHSDFEKLVPVVPKVEAARRKPRFTPPLPDALAADIRFKRLTHVPAL